MRSLGYTELARLCGGGSGSHAFLLLGVDGLCGDGGGGFPGVDVEQGRDEGEEALEIC